MLFILPLAITLQGRPFIFSRLVLFPQLYLYILTIFDSCLSQIAFEGMYEFPSGTTMAPHQVLVIASSAAVFRQTYGQDPDFEFYDTDPVPNLIPFLFWGSGEWQLRDDGDEVLLLDELNQVVDVLVYGDSTYPGVTAHPGVSLFTHSLERFPPWFDTDDCSVDFRDWPFPNPGTLPASR